GLTRTDGDRVDRAAVAAARAGRGPAGRRGLGGAVGAGLDLAARVRRRGVGQTERLAEIARARRGEVEALWAARRIRHLVGEDLRAEVEGACGEVLEHRVQGVRGPG